MISVDFEKITELITDAADTHNIGKAYSAKQILKKLLIEPSILLTQEQKIRINKVLGEKITKF